MFTELSSQSSKFSTSLEFMVLGIVDMNAIPEDEKVFQLVVMIIQFL